MTDRYTSEEFDHAAKLYKHAHYADESVILAALRIASRVMEAGVLEGVLRVDEATIGRPRPGDRPAGIRDTGILSARAVRDALLEGADHG